MREHPSPGIEDYSPWFFGRDARPAGIVFARGPESLSASSTFAPALSEANPHRSASCHFFARPHVPSPAPCLAPSPPHGRAHPDDRFPLHPYTHRSAPLGGGKKEGSDYGASSDREDDANYYMGVPKEQLFNTPEEGLTEAEAAIRLERFGPNKLREKENNVWLKLFLEFVQPMPLMIWMAIAIESLEAYLHDSVDGWIDVAVLVVLQLLNVLVGFIEELKAGDSIAALRESLKPEATVKREGRVYNIDATTLVPGDIVCLGAGGAIPADCILREGKPIQVDQAAPRGSRCP